MTLQKETPKYTVEIREIDNPSIKAKIDKVMDQSDYKDLILESSKKDKIIDSKDITKSLRIDEKIELEKPKEIVLYVYIFQAKEDIFVKKDDNGRSKVRIFYKGDYVFMYSRHGDRFPEPDQNVIFRSDRTNRNPVDGNVVVKRYIYNREFPILYENCYFVGRHTYRAKAVVMGKKKGDSYANMYGIVLNADKVNQKKTRDENEPKEFPNDTLWISIDEKDAEAAKKDVIFTETYCKIETLYDGKVECPYSQTNSEQPSNVQSPVAAPQDPACVNAAPEAVVAANDEACSSPDSENECECINVSDCEMECEDELVAEAAVAAPAEEAVIEVSESERMDESLYRVLENRGSFKRPYVPFQDRVIPVCFGPVKRKALTPAQVEYLYSPVAKRARLFA